MGNILNKTQKEKVKAAVNHVIRTQSPNLADDQKSRLIVHAYDLMAKFVADPLAFPFGP
jgi:hypothetical protein